MEIKGRFKVVDVLKKTSTSPFHNVEVGDIIHISLKVRGTGRASRGSYAVVFKVVNEGKTGEQYIYGSRLGDILDKNVKLEEI